MKSRAVYGACRMITKDDKSMIIEELCKLVTLGSLGWKISNCTFELIFPNLESYHTSSRTDLRKRENCGPSFFFHDPVWSTNWQNGWEYLEVQEEPVGSGDPQSAGVESVLQCIRLVLLQSDVAIDRADDCFAKKRSYTKHHDIRYQIPTRRAALCMNGAYIVWNVSQLNHTRAATRVRVHHFDVAEIHGESR